MPSRNVLCSVSLARDSPRCTSSRSHDCCRRMESQVKAISRIVITSTVSNVSSNATLLDRIPRILLPDFPWSQRKSQHHSRTQTDETAINASDANIYARLYWLLVCFGDWSRIYLIPLYRAKYKTNGPSDKCRIRLYPAPSRLRISDTRAVRPRRPVPRRKSGGAAVVSMACSRLCAATSRNDRS